MSASSPPQFNPVNSALVHEEVLLDISMVLEHGKSVGPSFLHSFGTVAEAVVLHDRVFFDPYRRTQERLQQSNTIEALVWQSGFVQELLHEGALALPPPRNQIDAWLETKGTDYRAVDFLTDAYWDGRSFTFTDVEGETAAYRNLIDLVKNAPSTFAAQRLVGSKGDDLELIVNPAAFLARYLGFSADDLALIEGWNHRAAAYVELSGHLGLHLYPVYAALPHQLGAVGAHHFQVRSIYDKVEEHAIKDDEAPVGASAFSRVPCPPLAQIAMARCKGDSAALAHELLVLRERHRKFRGYLTDFDRAWNEAQTREDRRRLRRDFEGAWQALLTKENQLQPGKASRIIGFLWDLVKGLTPTGAVKAGGDKVMTIPSRGENLTLARWLAPSSVNSTETSPSTKSLRSFRASIRSVNGVSVGTSSILPAGWPKC